MFARSLRFISLFAIFSLGSVVDARCYYRNGGVADGDGFQKCPGLAWCCKKSDSCASNGLCIDINNRADGGLTKLSDGKSYNFTGLYQTAACTDPDFNQCETQCGNDQSKAGAYIWSCDANNSQFCCVGSYSLFQQGSCCVRQDNQFGLDDAKRIAWNADPAVVSASISGSPSSSQAPVAASSNPPVQVASSSASSSRPSSSAASSVNSPSVSSTSSPASSQAALSSTASSSVQSPSGSTVASSTSSAITGLASSPTLSEASSNSTSKDNPGPDSKSGGMSPGARIGVGVGVGVGVLILLIAAFFAYRATKKRAANGSYAQAAQHELPTEHVYPPKPIEKFGNSYYAGPGYSHEAPGHMPELQGYQRSRMELP